jgi:hypothetical protein
MVVAVPYHVAGSYWGRHLVARTWRSGSPDGGAMNELNKLCAILNGAD